MKAKLLKRIRKHYEYKFSEGSLLTKRRCDNYVEEHSSICLFLKEYLRREGNIEDSIRVGSKRYNNLIKRKNANLWNQH